jgi:hypothetical protein
MQLSSHLSQACLPRPPCPDEEDDALVPPWLDDEALVVFPPAPAPLLELDEPPLEHAAMAIVMAIAEA